MKIILLGTPFFAFPIFKKIIEDFEVVGLVTQSDKPSARNNRIVFSPIKKLALNYEIPLWQPKRIVDLYDELKKIEFDILLTCAYGQFLPEEILKLPRLVALNIHASLLPKYRGAAPIHYALLHNETTTGISLIYMTKKMDAGNILFKKSLSIDKNENLNSLSQKLSLLATENITTWLQKINTSKLMGISQDPKLVSFAPKIKKSFYEINHHSMVKEALQKINKFGESPGIFLINQGIRYKIFNASEKKITNSIPYQLKNGFIYLLELQKENKKRMFVKDFLQGNIF